MLVVEEVEGAGVVAVGLAKALAALCSARGLRERIGGLPDRRLDRAAGDLPRQPACLLEMPGDDLDELLALAANDRHPVREAKVKLRSAALRHLAVGDVAHQDVLERVLVLARDGGDGLVRDEVTPFELSEAGARIVRLCAVPNAQVRDGARPEDGARSRTRGGRAAFPRARAGRVAS